MGHVGTDKSGDGERQVGLMRWIGYVGTNKILNDTQPIEVPAEDQDQRGIRTMVGHNYQIQHLRLYLCYREGRHKGNYSSYYDIKGKPQQQFVRITDYR